MHRVWLLASAPAWEIEILGKDGRYNDVTLEENKGAERYLYGF